MDLRGRDEPSVSPPPARHGTRSRPAAPPGDAPQSDDGRRVAAAARAPTAVAPLIATTMPSQVNGVLLRRMPSELQNAGGETTARASPQTVTARVTTAIAIA